MGFFKSFFAKIGLRRPAVRVLCVGLDNGGKSTVINWLKPRKANAIEVVPTIGFQVEEFTKNNVNFTIFDMSGQGRYRNLWEHYYDDTMAIIFVVDTSDKIRLCVAKDELDNLLGHPSIKKSQLPILFFANKSDIPGSISSVEVVQALSLDSITDRPWHISTSNALTGEGLEEGVTWLTSHIV
eukprot:Phypoly_transcript_22051.p1 GENE.Phypoly_transcript_22051~~Phypoly_transcript_22051.p1  ORF type:complete len:183 (+),score=20.88 Phypoly_transcript_22051:56-604(+)